MHKITIRKNINNIAGNMEFGANGVRIWSQNRYPKSSNINAKTGSETNHKNDKTLCFSEW